MISELTIKDKMCMFFLMKNKDNCNVSPKRELLYSIIFG